MTREEIEKFVRDQIFSNTTWEHAVQAIADRWVNDHAVTSEVDPGEGTVVAIEFESEEKADKFRKEFYINGKRTTTLLRWDRYDDDAYALVWLAEDDD